MSNNISLIRIILSLCIHFQLNLARPHSGHFHDSNRNTFFLSPFTISAQQKQPVSRQISPAYLICMTCQLSRSYCSPSRIQYTSSIKYFFKYLIKNVGPLSFLSHNTLGNQSSRSPPPYFS